MGTETIGSIVTPASRAALYALKPTVGVQDPTGLYTLTDFFDSPGPMAKCAADVLALTEILFGQSLSLQNRGSWDGLSVAFLDPGVWYMAEAMCRQHEGTAEQMVRVNPVKSDQSVFSSPTERGIRRRHCEIEETGLRGEVSGWTCGHLGLDSRWPTSYYANRL